MFGQKKSFQKNEKMCNFRNEIKYLKRPTFYLFIFLEMKHTPQFPDVHNFFY